MIKNYREDFVELTPENELDIIILYYIFTNIEDLSILTKVYWQEKQESGRKNIRLSRRRMEVELRPYNVLLSNDLKSIRITGQVVASYPEKFLKGRSIGVSINLGDKTILKDGKELLKLLDIIPSSKGRGIIFFVLGIDSYTVGKVNGDLNIVNQRLYQYSKYTPGSDEELDKYKEDVKNDLMWAVNEKKKAGYAIIVGVNIVSKRYITTRLRKHIDLIIEGDFEGDTTGLTQLIRNSKVRDHFRDNYYINKLAVYSEALAKLERGEVIYGFDEVSAAVKYGSIKKLVVSYDVVKENPDVINLIIDGLRRRVAITILNRGDYAYFLVKRYGGLVALF